VVTAASVKVNQAKVGLGRAEIDRDRVAATLVKANGVEVEDQEVTAETWIARFWKY
jgi:hypothetical protein